MIVEILTKLAGETVATVIVRSAESLLKAVPLTTRGMHRRELMEKVKGMPFIYRDLDGDIINDFVDPDIHAIDIESLSPPSGVRARVEDRLRDRKRALVLGNAGIGKTTFLRREILSLLSSKGHLDHYMDKETLLPFYVPLKAVDNSHSHPILQHLLRTNSFLRRSGIRRLTKLAQRCELFLFLDGYDEVQIGTSQESNRTHNFLATELKYFFQSHVLIEAGDSVPPEYLAFYRAVQYCRVWISSRKEFFLLNPISFENAVASRPTQIAQKVLKQATAIELGGVGGNRRLLIEKIFDKYIQRAAHYRDLLSAEYFEQLIDRSRDSELVNLSYNPLFLTVMTYIYVGSVAKADSHEVSFGSSVYELILECVSLLLDKIDKQKADELRRAGDLSTAQHDALLKRRNDYIPEKKNFLSYFAWTVLWEGKSFFELTYLKEQAIRFFKEELDEENSQVILRELESPIGAGSDISLQLMFSGLFVLVEKTSDGTVMYDFPHRRFREVLASLYFEKLNDRPAAVREILSRSDIIESLYVFYANSNYKEEIAQTILDASRGADNLTAGTVLLNCLSKTVATERVRATIEDYLRSAINSGFSFRLPWQICGYVNNMQSISVTASRALLPALSGLQMQVASLCCTILAHHDAKELVRLLDEASRSLHLVGDSSFLAMKYLWQCSRKYCFDNALRLLSDQDLTMGWFLAIAEASLSQSGMLEICEEVLKVIPREKGFIMLAILNYTNRPFLSALIVERKLTKEQQEFVALLRFDGEFASGDYVVTTDIVDVMAKSGTLRDFFADRIATVITQKEMRKFELNTRGFVNPLSGLPNLTHLDDSVRSARQYSDMSIPKLPAFFHGH